VSQTLISNRYPQVLGAMRRVFKDVGGVGGRASAHSLGLAPQDHPGLLVRVAAPHSLPITIALFAAAFVVLAWPWLSGAVTIPWDAKSQFFPALQFLSTSIARGEWPWWSPNVFAGWPMIADPQSLLCSPLHVAWALLHPAIGLHAFDVLTFAYLFLGGLGIILFFHDRGWHPAGALVAALAFAFGASASARIQHTIQIVSLSYLPVALWLVARALERSSWRTGVAAGVVIGPLAVGRDQVALLSLYVIAGFVLGHWLIGPAPLRRMRASLAAVCAAGLTAFFIAIVPVVLSALLAARSNRPEIDFTSAAAGSLHPVHLLQFVFADLFGAMSPDVEYWAPQSATWDAAWGSPGLFLSQNMGLIYAGALTFAAVMAFGVLRGLAWTREIRFFSIATVLLLLYAVGAYTPAFELMYDALPGVALFRRPADATFVLGALYAVIAGYLVHCWLAEGIPEASARHHVAEIACAVILVAGALWLAHSVVGVSLALVPVLTALAFTAAAVGVLVLARRVNRTAPILATAFIAALMTADLGWNNAPHISTALPPGQFEALAQGTQNETVRLLKAKLGEAAAPDRRDRVELIGIAYHWPNLSLAQDFDHVFGHNPLRLRRFHDATHVGDTVAIPSQRTFSPLYPSYRSAFADLLGVRFVATGVPVEEIDASLHSGDLNLIARTEDAYVYENPRALPRVMLMTDWRIADFDEVVRSGWPALDPARIVLLQHSPSGVAASSSRDGHARLLRYANTEVAIQADAPAQGGVLLLNDVWHPWWRATVDGREAEILKANVIFRSVAVPPGTHIVRFTFHPLTGAWDELMSKFKQGAT
jgi:hypothetical protein